ncbi:MAG: cadherin-like domain-containing protein [Pirellulales bacterium]
MVYAGADLSISLNQNAALSGEILVNLPQNMIVSWNQVSGPGTVTLGDPNTTNTTASFSTVGTYILELTADNGGSAASDRVTINVTTRTPPATLAISQGVALYVNTEMQFTGNNDHVVIAHDDAYLLDEGTIAFWFQAENTNTQQGLFSKDAAGFGTGGHLSFTLESDGLVSVRLQSTGGSSNLSTNSSVIANTWHHVSLNFGAGGLELFLDGVSQQSATNTRGLGPSSGGSGNHEPIVLGASGFNSNDLLADPIAIPLQGGAIDEVVIIDHALSPQELAALIMGNTMAPIAPVASDSALSTGEGVPINAAVSATDANGDPLTYVLVNSTSNGILTFNTNGSFTYAPNSGFLGNDSFTFQANDGNLNSNIATVSIAVQVLNADETLNTNNPLSVSEGTTGTLTAALLATTDSDNTPAELLYTITSATNNGTLLLSGIATTSFTQADIDAGLVTYQHSGNETTTDSFSFNVNDTQGTGTNGTFNINVTPVNDEQVVATNVPLSATEGAASTITAAILTTTDSDNTPAELIYTVTSGTSNGAILLSGSATTTFTQADVNAGLVTYQHDGSQTATDSFAFSVDDNQGTSSTGTFNINVTSPSTIPELALWQQEMLSFGLQHGNALSAAIANGTVNFAVTYYDAARAFYNIADYTGDSSWNLFAEQAALTYRDIYVLPNNGGVPGYWEFTRGLTMHYERTGDVLSRDAVILLSQNAAYATDITPLAWTQDAALSREVAYAINSYLDAERLGAPRRDRLVPFVEQALGHLDQWFIEENDPEYAPFMFSLTAEALINYYNNVTPDPRIIESLEMGANYTWQTAWIPENETFFYRAHNPTIGAPDLNLLIAPVYEWLHQMTGNIQYRQQADQIFAGGVTQAFINGPKQFNQNYRWSFDYVAMRNTQPATAQLALSNTSEQSQSSELTANFFIETPSSTINSEPIQTLSTNQETLQQEISPELVNTVSAVADSLTPISDESSNETAHEIILTDLGTTLTMLDARFYWLDPLLSEDDSLSLI